LDAHRSKLSPQDPQWRRDLPERDQRQEVAPGLGIESVNWLDARWLELTRETTYMRGVLLLFGLASAGGAITISILAIWLLRIEILGGGTAPIKIGVVFFGFLMFLVGLGFLAFCFRMIRTDITMPRDLPLRFDREQRKVYSLEQKRLWNPFVTWPVMAREWNWDDVHGILTRYAGFTGKAYIQRFHVLMVLCKPGTLEAVDTIVLEGNSQIEVDMERTWSYVCTFMERGVDHVPHYPVRRQGVSLRRSLFQYIRPLDPTQEGREARASASGPIDLWFSIILSVLLAWIYVPIGLCHYIAMRLAPEPKWPANMEEQAGIAS